MLKHTNKDSVFNKHKVVVTGMGIVSSFGHDKKSYWQAIESGKSAITPWQPQGAEDYPVKYAATVSLSKLRQQFPQHFDNAPLLERRGYFGLVAALEAFKDAGLDNSKRIGCAACSGVPEMHESEMQELDLLGSYPEALVRHQPTEHSGLTVTNDSMVAAIAEKLAMTGPILNVNGACAGAAQAIGMAFKAIQRGEVDVMLAGGADAVTNTRVMSGLFLLGATATSSSRKDKLCCPFDQARSGLVAGEGGAFLVLESEASALARGATIYARVEGYGSSMDAYKVTAPHPEGHGAIKAMQAALDDAAVTSQDIEYINAHGTSTPLNDAIETTAIKTVFSDRAPSYPAVSSTKSMIGHWISAAAAPEAIATVMGLYHQIMPPTINLETPDAKCDLDYVAQHARPASFKYALSNSFGFGGLNACLVFGGYAHD
ncbi:MAG: 3-oxoacyl-ACP synthase [Kangiellaceae bacterium]|nr:3-oxoacyl-ACP synthase [Kangiellaceae bacterium]|tara:strand:+ start:3299 stop:4588 length:1290 start_codon:yes stop_codon:yes gene_type:complete